MAWQVERPVSPNVINTVETRCLLKLYCTCTGRLFGRFCGYWPVVGLLRYVQAWRVVEAHFYYSVIWKLCPFHCCISTQTVASLCGCSEFWGVKLYQSRFYEFHFPPSNPPPYQVHLTCTVSFVALHCPNIRMLSIVIYLAAASKVDKKTFINFAEDDFPKDR